MRPGREALRAGLLPHPGSDERDPADGVAHEGQSQRAEGQAREEHHEGQVCGRGVLHHPDEAPRPWVLVCVVAQVEERQQGHAEGQEPDHGEGYFGPGCGDQAGVQQRLGDAQAPLRRHGTAQEERAQAEKHQAAPQKLTGGVGVRRVTLKRVVTPGARRVPPEYQRSRDDVSRQIRGHQGAGEEQEGGL